VCWPALRRRPGWRGGACRTGAELFCWRHWPSPRPEHGQPRAQLTQLDGALRALKAPAEDVTRLLSFVSLNSAAIRKILKKYGKSVEASHAAHAGARPPSAAALLALPGRARLSVAGGAHVARTADSAPWQMQGTCRCASSTRTRADGA